ncbi:MAG: hypothetical protein JXQ82_01015 [Methanomicrobiaceae archaeon]|nr:hypothetical protein [Methanomicrobiaceae archaeon]
MKKIACLLILLLTLVCGADAYIINFEVPSKVNLGDTIVIQGTSTINPGVTMTIILYNQKNTIQEISRQSFTIQSDNSWSVTFETDGLEKGYYKLEIPATSNVDLGSSSTRYQMFEIIDRTGEVVITSPLTQEYTGYLSVSGRSTTRGNLGIKISVEKDDEVILPEEWISTNSNGEFSKDVPIAGPGTYYVSFSDNQGLVRLQKFSSEKTWQTPAQTASATTEPTTSQSGKTMAAQSFASNNDPAYFTIITNPGILKVDISEGHNWILKYADESGTVFTINQFTDQRAESFTIPVTGGIVYVKVYPSDLSDSGYVTLYTDGASSITVSGDAAVFFESQATPVPTQSGFFFPIALISCLIVFGFLLISFRRQ